MEGFTHVTKKNNGSEEIFLGCPNIPEATVIHLFSLYAIYGVY